MRSFLQRISPLRGRRVTSKELYLRLLSHVRPYWRQFAGGIASMVLLAATEPAIPILLKPLLDGTFVDKDPTYMFWTPLALVILFSIRGSMNFASSAAFEWVAGKLVLDLRRLMFARILALPAAYFDVNSTGNIVAKLTYNVEQVTNASTKVLTILVKDTIIVLGLLAYMLYLSWFLTLVVFTLMPVVVFAVAILAKRLRQINRKLQEAMGDMTHGLEEGVRGQKVIKLFQGESYEQHRFNGLANWVRRLHFKNTISGSIHMPLVELIGALIIALMIYIGTGQTGSGQLSVGGFVSLMAAIGLLFSPIKRLTSINQPLQRGLAAAESVFALVDEAPEAETGGRVIGRAEGRVTFENVSFRYPGAERDALCGVSFEARPGATIALVGHSGGGKSTIANLVPRFYLPTSGRILLDGIDIRELTLRSLRANLSFVGQDPLLFDDTVAANIGYGLADGATEQDIGRAAEDAYALEFIARLPAGFDTRIGEDGSQLSGGQRQRLAIARALIKDAPVLLLDEATSALDTASERQVQQALARLTRDRTTLVIAHRLSTIQHADEILVMKDGAITERGTHDALRSLNGEYARLCESQFGEQKEHSREG